MADELTQQEQLAYPFLEAALRIDAAIQSLEDKALLARVVVDSAALWLYFKDVQLPAIPTVPASTVDFVGQVSQFMIQAAELARTGIDGALLERLAAINLNMCEILLESPPADPEPA